MAAIHSDEFKRDAVRIATTSGLTKRQVASDLGVGLSTLNKWVKMVSDETGPADPDQNLLRENERLRRENRILKEERELLKKGETISAIGSRTMVEPVLRGPKAVKFAFVDDYRGSLSRAHACRVMGVTDRGLRAWKHRPVSHRQRCDMVLLAHIRNQHRLSQGSYGRPRMTEELNELGLRVGHRWVGRLMRQNAICVVRTHKFKATTDSDHTFNIAPNLLQQDFAASQPNQKWAGDITYVWTREV